MLFCEAHEVSQPLFGEATGAVQLLLVRGVAGGVRTPPERRSRAAPGRSFPLNPTAAADRTQGYLMHKKVHPPWALQ